jgi:N-acetylneuraminate synthase/N,N'-diacetyllegionaminate synthase
MKEFHIGNKLICHHQPCFVIAEIGLNHNGKEGLAVKLVEEAAKAGADAVKLSKFDTHMLPFNRHDSSLCIDDTCGYHPVVEEYKHLELSNDTFLKIAGLCKRLGIHFLSTPFNEENVDFLIQIPVPVIKIASGDLTNDPFLKYIASKKIPVILSTGMASLDEIKHAVWLLNENQCPELALLHCVSSYPAKPNELNLRVIDLGTGVRRRRHWIFRPYCRNWSCAAGSSCRSLYY